MNDDLLKRLEIQMSTFSKGQKKIARYFLEHYDKAAFMTASKLGAAVGVSESTVVRFAFDLGYAGYPRLQKVLQDYIKAKLTSVQRIEVSNDRLADTDILTNVLSSDMDKIRITLDETNREDFVRVVDLLLNARNIYILGVRSSSALASFMGFYFNLIFDNVKLIHTNSVSEMFEQMLRVKEGDAVIGISFPRYSSRTVKALEFAKDRNAKVVALTDSTFSPVAKHADYTLVARSDMISFVDSLVAPLSLINALIVAISLKKKVEINETFNRLEHIWDEYQVYDKQVEL